MEALGNVREHGGLPRSLTATAQRFRSRLAFGLAYEESERKLPVIFIPGGGQLSTHPFEGTISGPETVECSKSIRTRVDVRRE